MTEGLPQTKTELIERIRASRAALEADLTRFEGEELSRPGPDGGWSVMDHLAHLAAWCRKQIALIEGRSAYEGLGLDREQYEHSDLDAINAALYARNRSRPPLEVLSDFRQSHQVMLNRLSAMSEDDLRRSNNLADPEDHRTLIEGIVGNTYEHDDEHREWIGQIRF